MIISLVFGGCAGMTQPQQRTVTGSAAGAAGGAVIGSIVGNTAIGAAIGGAAELAMAVSERRWVDGRIL